MQKQLERRITLQPYQPLKSLTLTSYPIGMLRNPGIGTNIFDVMLPLYGNEKFEMKKTEATLPGSFEENSLKKVKQEGFGVVNEEGLVSNNDDKKVANLGDVFNAMQKASINVSAFKYEPTTSGKLKKIKKKRITSHKFTFV